MIKYTISHIWHLKKSKLKYLSYGFFLLLFLFTTSIVQAQSYKRIQGTVLDENNKAIEGASIRVKDANTITTSSAQGRFVINVPQGKNTLIISMVGYKSIEKNIGSQTDINIILVESSVEIEETIVVGYGKQRKESVVGAITQTTGEVLERTGGVTNLGMALTGNLPGLVTTSSTGMPGGEDPQILIRAQTSWNSSSPLILVDGIERSIGTIDIASVESISVLKDASATAVFGVKGANGVILIKTKEGIAGKATIRGRVNSTAKVPSKLPSKYDSYDGLSLRNRVVENELMVLPTTWAHIRPEEILLKYRNPLNDEEWDRYPNTDWEEELFREYATSYGANVNVQGGSDIVKYFASIDYVGEGDLFKTFENNRGYKSNFRYDRLNVRSNLDFSLSKTTKFSTKLFGSNGVRQYPFGVGGNDGRFWTSVYRTAPDAMRPIYSDGTWGYYPQRDHDVPNSMYILAFSGAEKSTQTQLTTDFTINQDLNSLLPGLTFRANYSIDNTFRENGRGVTDPNQPVKKWIDPATGNMIFDPIDLSTNMDQMDMIRWSNQSGSVDKGATYRRINYSGQLNYSKTIGKHEVSATGVFMREKFARGSEFARYREDWVFRTVYDYDRRYLFEANGAYNGSEKFGPDYRFDFFPSLAAGWIVSNEKFMENVKFIRNLKLRASWGKIGDDNGGGRWLYNDQWGFGGNTQMGSPLQNTPYTFYRINTLGNPYIAWEKVEKRNFGIEYSLFNGFVSGDIDFFQDMRTDILISGGSRAVPSYFGQSAPIANLGSVEGKGYEFTLNLNHKFASGLRLWANTSLTYAENTVLFRDDPSLLPEYQKQQNMPLGQARSFLNHGYLQTWDDIYGSTKRTSNDNMKLAGDYNIIDFNADGVIDRFDSTPYEYSGSPRNTYNASVGAEWNNLSIFLQFYGVNNVTREVTFPTFNTYSGSNVAYVEGTYWTKENGGGSIPLPRYSSAIPFGGEGTRYLYDGSYVRLKNAEVAYTVKGNSIKKLGLNACRIYLNGNNLLLWTKMPDDRESNFAGGSSGGAYPTLRRYNIGLDITF
ncbi:SusC/RagA family TonB-linked outer membrane protein [Sphingobacterium sp. WQ 366]|uniref:SusC/RagA family TonB-linked outer membrane protein n=2 Tax=Sphingobacterium bovistauri TaxID=2781959 RepID=A0ABS7Z3N5_9SPHI|nr:SusC/RagA family TonB-linked outer membrane protein [Sphingobacterium bovistauri]